MRRGAAVSIGLSGLVAAMWLVLAAAGCGHEVTPTSDFDDPAEIPRPLNLQAASFHDNVTVTWFTEPGIFAFVDGWHVYRAVGDGAPNPGDYTRINPEIVQRNDYRDEGVIDGTRYWYVVTSQSPAGIESEPTDPASVRVDSTAPDSPAWIRVSVQFNDVFLRWEALVVWEASAAADFRHYNLYREPGIPNLPVVPDLVEPRWVDDTVLADSVYTYRVTAVDGNLNESAASDSVTVTIPGSVR